MAVFAPITWTKLAKFLWLGRYVGKGFWAKKSAQLVIPVRNTFQNDLHPPIGGPHPVLTGNVIPRKNDNAKFKYDWKVNLDDPIQIRVAGNDIRPLQKWWWEILAWWKIGNAILRPKLIRIHWIKPGGRVGGECDQSAKRIKWNSSFTEKWTWMIRFKYGWRGMTSVPCKKWW